MANIGKGLIGLFKKGSQSTGIAHYLYDRFQVGLEPNGKFEDCTRKLAEKIFSADKFLRCKR